MIIKNKGISVPIIILIVVVAAVVIGGVVVWQGWQTPGAPSPTPTPTPTLAPTPVATPTPLSTKEKGIHIIYPVGGEQLQLGKEYKIQWSGGSGKITISLIDKSLESQGASASITFRSSEMENKGFYDFPIEYFFVRGPYKFYISDNIGNYAYSNYFFTVSQVFDRNADWKVYRDEKLGYEIKYPSNWRATTGSQGRLGIEKIMTKEEVIACGEPYIENIEHVSILIQPYFKTLEDWIREGNRPENKYKQQALNSISTMEIGGEKVRVCSDECFRSQQLEEGVVFVRDNFVYMIYHLAGCGLLFDNGRDTFRKILSTFRFLK